MSNATELTLNDAFLVSFKEWLNQKQVTANTVRAYHSRVKQFLLFVEYSNLQSRQPFQDLKGMDELMHVYLEHLHECGNTPQSINGTVNALNSFSRFLGMQVVHPLKRVRNYCNGLGSPRTLSRDQLAAFLRCLDAQPSARDRALCLMLLHSGLRLSECAQLSVSDVTFAGGAAVVCINGTQSIKLNDAMAVAELQQWIKERQMVEDNSRSTAGIAEKSCSRKSVSDVAHATPHYTALWLNRHEQPISVNGIAFVVRKIGWQAGLAVSPEVLRQTGLAAADALAEISSAEHNEPRQPRIVAASARRTFGAAATTDPKAA